MVRAKVRAAVPPDADLNAAPNPGTKRNRLKIDKQFVKPLGTRRTRGHHPITALGCALGESVLAKGFAIEERRILLWPPVAPNS